MDILLVSIHASIQRLSTELCSSIDSRTLRAVLTWLKNVQRSGKPIQTSLQHKGSLAQAPRRRRPSHESGEMEEEDRP